jgi:hypothetical protein
LVPSNEVGLSNKQSPPSVPVHPGFTALKQRKEYVLWGGLALADMLSGFAYVYAGAMRLYLTLNGKMLPLLPVFWNILLIKF